MQQKIGFIGGGNMGGAIIAGIRKAELVSGSALMVSDKNTEALKRLEENYEVLTTLDNKEVASFADILFLAVKPNLFADVIAEIKDVIKEDVLIVSIAAGKTIKEIETTFGKNIKLVRTMPNTPAMVGEGMSALCPNELVTEEEVALVKEIFSSFGVAEVVKESLIDAVIGISGSSPAYVYMFIEAMADAAVMGGMPRKQAYTFAAQAVLGSAKMVLETGIHPGELKDMVCSPGGTTIDAVLELEKQGMRSAVMEAVKVCMDKSKAMSK